MHQVSYSRIAAAGVLALSLTACGGESDQASISGANSATGLQRGDDVSRQNAWLSSTANASESTSVSASKSGGIQRGDDPVGLYASATGAASPAAAAVSLDDSSAVRASAASTASSTQTVAPVSAASAPASGMSSGDSPSAAASATLIASAAAASVPVASVGMQRGDDVQSSAALAPAATAPAAGSIATDSTASSATAGAASGATAGAIAGSAPLAPTSSPVVTTSAAPTAPPVSYRRKVPMSAPVAVPVNFTGIHSHYWPGPAPAPTYEYGTVRSLNYYGDYETLGILWYGISTADGVYNWSKMDNWVNTHHSAGKQIIYSVYGTPEWCASNLGIKDLYNRAGGDSKPASLTCVQKFVDALVKRYNGDGTRRIQKIEIWNEPNFQGYAYWRNSAADLAALGRTVYQTAKAVDPGVQILWPAFVEWYSTPVVWADNVEYANASDGAGGTGKQWADAYAFHFYAYNTGMDDLMNNQESAIKTLAAIGRPDLDRHNTEMGFGDGYGETLSTAVKATTIQRWMALSAAYGNKVAALYAHESGHIGAPAYTPEISAAITELNQKLAGKTIRDAGVLEDGRVFIVFGDNSTWTI